MLKILEFGHIFIDEDTEDDFISKKVSGIQALGLESLRIFEVAVDAADDSMAKSNIFFNDILGSCPNLRNIKIDTSYIVGRAVIYLDFRENPLLRHIENEMSNCRCYIFQHEFGKQWRNFNKEIKQTDFTAKQEKNFPL